MQTAYMPRTPWQSLAFIDEVDPQRLKRPVGAASRRRRAAAMLVTRRGADGLWGFQNSGTRFDLGFYAARPYSLISPPRTGRRLVRFWQRSATGWSGWAGCLGGFSVVDVEVGCAGDGRFEVRCGLLPLMLR